MHSTQPKIHLKSTDKKCCEYRTNRTKGSYKGRSIQIDYSFKWWMGICRIN